MSVSIENCIIRRVLSEIMSRLVAVDSRLEAMEVVLAEMNELMEYASSDEEEEEDDDSSSTSSSQPTSQQSSPF